MDTARPSSPQKLLTLEEAALKLGVSIDVLLKWNEYHILKPTITQSGEIGYTHEQITQFQTIRQFLQAQGQIPEVLEEKLMETFDHQSPTSASVSHVAIINPAQDAKPSSQIFKKFSSPLLMASFAGTLFVIALTAFIIQGSLSHDTITTDNVLGTQTSALTFTGPIGSTHLSDTNSAFGQKVSTVLNEKHTLAKAITPIPSIKAGSKPSDVELAAATVAKEQAIDADNPLLHDTTPLLSMSHPAVKPVDTTKSTFDANGNITGSAPKDALASIIGGTNAVSDTSAFQQTDIQLRNQFIVLLMGTLGLSLFYFKKPRKTVAVPVKTSTQSDKVLEIDQKMDGTVILSFQGNTYKISKPELSSDSDRFIERLMELVKPGMKEVEYDSWTDEKMRLSAPLSRLVTRLGFVGVKRDLFFPRTSKNRVLFRKYITQDDLKAMSITTEELAKDLLQNLQS